MLLGNSGITQEAYSGEDTYQAGRDNNITKITYAALSSDNIFFYDDDIKDVIEFFYENLDSLNDTPFPDNKPIDLLSKNLKNKLTNNYFEEIKEKYLPQFGKIRSFLGNPRNEKYVKMYITTTEELQSLCLSLIPSVDCFDKIFQLLYQYIIRKREKDTKFMKIRTKVLLFLHFMYYNCDIGIK
nr:MAG TPA: hypothetical protein [Caudoviricetes sp.]